jgi:hypothetical protein
MVEKEIEKFLTYLAVDKKVTPATQNQALNSIIYLSKLILWIDPGSLSSFLKTASSCSSA